MLHLTTQMRLLMPCHVTCFTYAVKLSTILRLTIQINLRLIRAVRVKCSMYATNTIVKFNYSTLDDVIETE